MSKREILLVEPADDHKYPPLGLMKIASYHRQLGDGVTFVRGCSAAAAQRFWDRIYITSLFTFDWPRLVETINFYKKNLFGSCSKVLVGGIAASLRPDVLFADTGIYPIRGCLNQPGMLDADSDVVVDRLPPDHSILKQVDYEYAATDAYISYTTRGCLRRCNFCAVSTLEPEFIDYIDIKPYVRNITSHDGEKPHLLLLDNNVLASSKLERIIDDICSLGFARGSKFHGKTRCVDFNQGLDARLLTPKRMALLARLNIKPFRLAYDDPAYGIKYETAVRVAANAGVQFFSTYLLYNFKDKPTDLWDRVHRNVELSDELGIKISSFPMKYIPIEGTDRRHVGPHWHRKLLRGIQCVTLVTGGIISARHDFFHKAFGRNHREYLEILSMPEDYIIHRSAHEKNGAIGWREEYHALTSTQRLELLTGLSAGIGRADLRSLRNSKRSGRVRNILRHYLSKAGE